MNDVLINLQNKIADCKEGEPFKRGTLEQMYVKTLESVNIPSKDMSEELEIRKEIYRAIQKLGGKSDILAIIGSWGDSLTDEELLHELKMWNKLT